MRWPQAYWLTLAAEYRLFGHRFEPAIVLQSLLGGISAVAVFALARRILPRQQALAVGLHAAAVTAVWGWVVQRTVGARSATQSL